MFIYFQVREASPCGTVICVGAVYCFNSVLFIFVYSGGHDDERYLSNLGTGRRLYKG